MRSCQRVIDWRQKREDRDELKTVVRLAKVKAHSHNKKAVKIAARSSFVVGH